MTYTFIKSDPLEVINVNDLVMIDINTRSNN